MSLTSKLNLNLEETFPLLAHAPIIEAVIEVRARAETPWEESVILERLKTNVPEYPDVKPQKEFRFEVKMALGEEAEQNIQDLGFRGVRLESADKLHIAQFNRDGFLFSRLRPYESWDQFHREGLRLWQVYQELAQPLEIHRLGLRFINKMEFTQKELQLEDYLQIFPQTPKDLDIPFTGFLYRDELGVPGHPYAINLIRTVQPPQGPAAEGVGLILDIDVFTTQPFESQRSLIEQRLTEMRWLKNKVFFGSITNKAQEKFQ